LLVYVVLFNHQAERQSFIIAATGAVIWFVTSPPTLERATLVALALIGVPTFPYIALWLVIQTELLRGTMVPVSDAAYLAIRTRLASPAFPRSRSRGWKKAS
jgi:hypothetical protein